MICTKIRFLALTGEIVSEKSDTLKCRYKVHKNFLEIHESNNRKKKKLIKRIQAITQK